MIALLHLGTKRGATERYLVFFHDVVAVEKSKYAFLLQDWNAIYFG